mgnify:CR=1 FL=1
MAGVGVVLPAACAAWLPCGAEMHLEGGGTGATPCVRTAAMTIMVPLLLAMTLVYESCKQECALVLDKVRELFH